ncbi:hypothetical protein BGW38_004549 [Lunasporangiospora selenospora]|uniref:BTB domain-containing protein n=1 Tax=Lunasporangiospora selenospora TaxID=979761 RepID=A0A9P6KBG7_9FUNG|nr:hypothetical protein BGW38_004549 [Lunasporangiospora selenospora]
MTKNHPTQMTPHNRPCLAQQSFSTDQASHVCAPSSCPQDCPRQQPSASLPSHHNDQGENTKAAKVSIRRVASFPYSGLSSTAASLVSCSNGIPLGNGMRQHVQGMVDPPLAQSRHAVTPVSNDSHRAKPSHASGADPSFPYLKPTTVQAPKVAPIALTAPLVHHLTDLVQHISRVGFQAGVASDLSVRAFGQSYALHRLILIQARFFATAIQGGPWLEHTRDRIDMSFDDPNITREGFELALGRLYGAWIESDELEPMLPGSFRTRGLFVRPGPAPCTEPPPTTLHTHKTNSATRDAPTLNNLPTLKGQRVDTAVMDSYKLSSENVLSVLATSVYLGIDSLANEATLYTIRTISAETTLDRVRYCHHNNYYPWTQKIARACHAYLCRNAYDEPKIQCLDILECLPTVWVLSVLTSDALWIPREWERYKLCRRVVHERRRRQQQLAFDKQDEWDAARDPDAEQDEALYETLFSQGIIYTHMSFTQLEAILHDEDPCTGTTFAPTQLIHKALWDQAELCTAVKAAHLSARQGGYNPTLLGLEVPEPVFEMDYARPDLTRRCLESRDRIPHESAPMVGTYFPPLLDLQDMGVLGVGVEETCPKRYTKYAPFRFGVEFRNVKDLTMGEQLASDPFFYAGLFISKMPSDTGYQLGAHLYRQGVSNHQLYPQSLVHSLTTTTTTTTATPDLSALAGYPTVAIIRTLDLFLPQTLSQIVVAAANTALATTIAELITTPPPHTTMTPSNLGFTGTRSRVSDPTKASFIQPSVHNRFYYAKSGLPVRCPSSSLSFPLIPSSEDSSESAGFPDQSTAAGIPLRSETLVSANANGTLGGSGVTMARRTTSVRDIGSGHSSTTDMRSEAAKSLDDNNNVHESETDSPNTTTRRPFSFPQRPRPQPLHRTTAMLRELDQGSGGVKGPGQRVDENGHLYADQREEIQAWFRIFAPSFSPLHDVTQFQSSPENFTAMQCWGWKSSMLSAVDYMPVNVEEVSEVEYKLHSSCPGRPRPTTTTSTFTTLSNPEEEEPLCTCEAKVLHGPVHHHHDSPYESLKFCVVMGIL